MPFKITLSWMEDYTDVLYISKCVELRIGFPRTPYYCNMLWFPACSANWPWIKPYMFSATSWILHRSFVWIFMVISSMLSFNRPFTKCPQLPWSLCSDCQRVSVHGSNTFLRWDSLTGDEITARRRIQCSLFNQL